jgi:hypothetical protein
MKALSFVENLPGIPIAKKHTTHLAVTPVKITTSAYPTKDPSSLSNII